MPKWNFCLVLLSRFGYVFVAPTTQNKSKTQIRPEILLNLSPNPTRKTLPDVQLCFGRETQYFVKNTKWGLQAKSMELSEV